MEQEWKLFCPAPATGTPVKGVYHAGAGLADDTLHFTEEDAHMQIVTGQTAATYRIYTDLLTKAGYRTECQNQLGHNLHGDFSKKTERGIENVHVNYIAATEELRIIEDPVSTPLREFSYASYKKKESVKPAVYQYGLYYDPQNCCRENKTVNCGMLYAVTLSDGSLFLIDGGHLYQSSDTAIEGLWKFLHEITDTAEGTTLRIAAWYITHAHNDHIMGVTKLLNRYRKEIDLQRIMYNFPSYQVRSGGYDCETDLMKDTVRRFFPDVSFLKLHTGQHIQLANISLDVLYTHEDAVTAEDLSVFPLGDYNCTSSVLRMEMMGKKVLWLGDTNIESEAVMTKITQPAVWKGDMVQVAHHCFNYLDTLYAWIAAPVAMLPNSYFGAHTPENTPKLQFVLQYVKENRIYYAGEATYGFQAQEDGFACICQAPVIGGEYDGSGFKNDKYNFLGRI